MVYYLLMKSKDKKIIDISVIVPTKNEELRIEKCLRALSEQKTTYTFEVIVVDTKSTDKTLAIAKKYHCQIIKENIPGRNIARKSGSDAARGKYICFTEADCIVPNSWIQRMGDAFGNDHIIGVVGTYQFINTTHRNEKLRKLFMPIADYYFRTAHGYFPFRASNCAIRSSTLKKIGGIHADAREFDEVELSMRASKEGYIKYIPSLQVITDDRRIRGRIFQHVKDVLGNYYKTVIKKEKISKQIYADIR